jgi:hypothetical protein
MGIRLDWEIQAEQAQVQNGGEDPEAARARRLARVKLLIVILILVAVAGGVVAAVILRLREADKQTEQLLRDTVEAEVTALRIGDQAAFLSVQHGGNTEWLLSQQSLFNQYQNLKVERNVQLTGQILDASIDGRRGRVQVEEIIDGVPYVNTWFYWRFETSDARNDENANQLGWRHVPPDYTFWGELRTYVGKGVTVYYRTVDNTFAIEMGLRIEEWLEAGCAVLVCENVPPVTVEILPDTEIDMAWLNNNENWHMRVPSPYYIRAARSDMPFDLDMQVQAANLLADRLVAHASNNLRPNYPADAYYLRSAVVSWLVGRFVHINTNSFLMSSLADHYGDQAVGLLVRIMQPDSNSSVFSLTTGIPSLADAKLDWRDFLTWRLVTEGELSARGDEGNFVMLYDTRDEQLRTTAYARYDANAAPEPRVVVLAPLDTSADGTPQLRATVRIGRDPDIRQELVLFRLVNNNWLRAS